MAVTYLSYAASNSARIEELALQAGMKKGGAAKGELVLAMYELAVCYRNGWGIKKDPVAAQHYYETAANLGDTDAMNEVAWCYMEGFGCKKDKVSHTPSRLLRNMRLCNWCYGLRRYSKHVMALAGDVWSAAAQPSGQPALPQNAHHLS